VNYLERTATASINIGIDGYFDNDTVLSQFERLFQMLQFKEDYKNHQIEIIVDNARTHTTKAYSLSDFNKGITDRCPIDKIEYIDENGVTQVINCRFGQGPNKGKGKGLVELSKDLGVQLPDRIKLNEIREILAKHQAFQKEGRIYFIFLMKYYSMPYNLLCCLGYKA